MTSSSTSGANGSTHANYGLDAPGVVRTMALGGIVLLLVCASGARLSAVRPVLGAIAQGLCWMGASLTATALFMIASSRWGKLRARDALLDRLHVDGADTVLDVGCGHGLLLIGAAKRLATGRAIGIDLWSQVDQHANSAQATRANASTEGVVDRVEVKDGDMRSLPFPDASFDVIVSSLAVHNLDSAADREVAMCEMRRVLRPGGRIGILDIAHVGTYAAVLRRLGCEVQPVRVTPWIFPPTRVLVATLPRVG